jgi:quercetin dioxygenase-like cupin family protein
MTREDVMTPEDFEAHAEAEGYGPPTRAEIAPNTRRETHTHDKISLVYVVEGTFILNLEDGAPRLMAGQTIELGPDIPHGEEAGPEGAVILVARKESKAPRPEA